MAARRTFADAEGGCEETDVTVIAKDIEGRLGLQTKAGPASGIDQVQIDGLNVFDFDILKDRNGKRLLHFTLGESERARLREVIRAGGGSAICGLIIHTNFAASTAGTANSNDCLPIVLIDVI